MNKREVVKALILAELARVGELLKVIPSSALKTGRYPDYHSTEKAELKAKMHELRRDTMRLEKMLTEWER